MKAVTASEMKEIDQKAMKVFQIPGLILMENAGIAVAGKAREMLGSAANPRVLVVSGEGNNGGDGFVAARHLLRSGVKTSVLLIGRKREVKGDAKVNLDIISKIVPLAEVSDTGAIRKLKSELMACDIVVDAIVGTGAKDQMKGLVANAIAAVVGSKKPVVCVDIPSGLNADDGSVLGQCVRGTVTVTFGLPKLGLLIYPGADYAGKVTVADIGLPQELLNDKKLTHHVLDAGEIAAVLPKRSSEAHKGSMGRVFILAGSTGYTGRLEI